MYQWSGLRDPWGPPASKSPSPQFCGVGNRRSAEHSPSPGVILEAQLTKDALFISVNFIKLMHSI